MTPLHPSHRTVLRIYGLMAALALAVPALIAIVAVDQGWWPDALIACVALLAAAFLILVMPERAYRAWSWEASEDELHIRHGLLFRTQTIVPFGRVQHIDVAQGPVQRRYRVGTLTVHTAGTLSNSVALPGLALEEAERMRDEIRSKIRQDLA